MRPQSPAFKPRTPHRKDTPHNVKTCDGSALGGKVIGDVNFHDFWYFQTHNYDFYERKKGREGEKERKGDRRKGRW